MMNGSHYGFTMGNVLKMTNLTEFWERLWGTFITQTP